MIPRTDPSPAARIRARAWMGAIVAGIVPVSTVCAATHYEFWPEVDAWVRLTDATQLLLIADHTRNSDGDKTAGEGGAYVDYRVNDRISVRGGFDYQRNLAETPGARDSIEHRYVLDFNYRWEIGQAWRFADRSRVDLRDIGSQHSHRLRNRLQVERDWQVAHATLVPYANLELYYDSRYDAPVTRTRVEMGVTVPFHHGFEATFYLGRQHDGQPASKDTAGLGVTLVGRF